MKELLYLKDEQLKDLIEKIFISYRETFSDAKKVLDKYSIGLAHHKVIHLLSMYQGISISELLKRLKVTKQSLNRVLKDLIEKLFVSYRETFSDAKKILSRYSIGIAHHKVIHLLSMYQGISISELLKRLKITKQSLNRVLKDLIKLDIITFKKDDLDTRVKHVFLNEKGKKIFNEIFNLQKKRIYNALLNSRSEEVINFDNVLSKIING